MLESGFFKKLDKNLGVNGKNLNFLGKGSILFELMTKKDIRIFLPGKI